MSETCVMKILLIAIQSSIQKILDPIDLYQIPETVLEQEQENIFFLATSQGWIIATSLYPRAIGIIFGIVLAIMDEPLASFRILRCCSA